jgi:hypothetical protein
VIGVVLLVAVTTILGSLVGAYSFGLIDGIVGEAAPQATFSVEQEGGQMNVTHTSGEPILAGEFYVVGGGLAEQRWAAAGGETTDGTVQAGDSLELSPTSSDDPVRLVWRAERGDRSAVLRTIPVESTGPAAFAGSVRTGTGFGDQQFADQSYTWTGRARYGEIGNWELKVGDSLSGGAQAGRTWTSGATESFELTYDGSGTATLTVGGTTISDSVSVPQGDAVAITVRAPSGGSATAKNVRIGGAVPATDSVTAADGDKQYIVVESVGTSDGFTITGEMVFTWTGTTGKEDPGMYIDVD